MELQVAPLPRGERADGGWTPWVDTHLGERQAVCHRRDDHLAAVLEGDEPSIEEVIDGRRQQQTVFPIQSFLVGRITPRFAVTGTQVFLAVHAGDATRML